jgi:hypothetical protein
MLAVVAVVAVVAQANTTSRSELRQRLLATAVLRVPIVARAVAVEAAHHSSLALVATRQTQFTQPHLETVEVVALAMW